MFPAAIASKSLKKKFGAQHMADQEVPGQSGCTAVADLDSFGRLHGDHIDRRIPRALTGHLSCTPVGQRRGGPGEVWSGVLRRQRCHDQCGEFHEG